jgi:predicted ATPase
LQSADCAVIGINDYFSIAGYKKIKEEIANSTLNIGKKKIFPVVEMRMTDSLQNRNTTTNGTTHFNFHIIFNDTLNIDDIESFIKSLNSGGSIIGSDYGDKTKLKDKKVSFDETLKKLKSDRKFQDNYLIWLPYDEYGGIGDIDPNSDGWIKEEFIKKSHILGSSNQNQIDFFLWKSPLKTDGSSKITKEQFEEWFEYKKPCIKGSDSHSHSDSIGKLKNERSEPIEKFCWIKAEPTFEGLKQVVYEPEDRVKIQELEPEEKEDYQIIDKVKFIDNSFYPEEILINQNLTTIIGGKSTGKSILLRNIAQTIDSKEVLNRLEEVKIDPYSTDVSDFQVVWRDNQINKKNETTGVNKKIIYIPQSYLNRLVDKKEGKTSIDEIIKNVLEKEEDVKTTFRNLENQNREAEKTITQNIEELFYKESDIQVLSENIKKIGDKKGIESEIEKLKKEVSELKKKAGMSDEEIKNYNETLEKITNLKATQEKFEKDLYSLITLKSQKNFGVFSSTQEHLNSLDSEIKKTLQNSLNKTLEEAETKWNETIEQEHKKLEKQKTDNQSKLEELYKSFNPLLEKAQKSKSLDEKIKKLEEEEKKLKKIIQEEKNLEKLNEDYKKLIKDISENHSKFFENFFNAKTEILKQRSITKDQDLEFGIEVVFENKSFQENCINDIFAQRKLNQFDDVSLQDYKYTKADFKSDIEKVIQAILNKKLNLKNSYSRKEAITKLTQSWFIFDYKIKQNGDEISEMSPGKKSFVLLKLLIELDNSKCPILLDQPEDDLDNRSIYNDLVKFIRTKKKERQFIIATHNPNLVVGADSECVIVANQGGDKSKNKTYKFEYVQGALENTFINESSEYVLEQRGIQEHVCDILEGGKIAFEQRKKKYNFT